ncbi:hypothetical protein Tco_0535419 [Tanacetum coccineum]
MTGAAAKASRPAGLEGWAKRLAVAGLVSFSKFVQTCTVEYHVQPVKNANLKWRELLSMKRHGYSERLSKLQGKGFGTPRVADWNLFYSYNFEETLRNKMKFEYIHSDGDVLVDYSWERALSIRVDRTKLTTEKCIWFTLCGIEKVLTLPEFAVLLGLYEEEELNHRLFDIHFTRLEVDDKLFHHEAFWQKIGTPNRVDRGKDKKGRMKRDRTVGKGERKGKTENGKGTEGGKGDERREEEEGEEMKNEGGKK